MIGIGSSVLSEMGFRGVPTDTNTGQRPQYNALLPLYQELKTLLEMMNFSSLSRSFGTGKHALW